MEQSLQEQIDILTKKNLDYQQALIYYGWELIDEHNIHYGYVRRPDCSTAIKVLKQYNTKID